MCAVEPKLSNLLKIDGFTYIVVGSFWYTFIMFQLLIDQSCCPVSFAKVQKDFAATMLLSGGGGYFRNFWVGMCHWDPGTLNLYQSYFS